MEMTLVFNRLRILSHGRFNDDSVKKYHVSKKILFTSETGNYYNKLQQPCYLLLQMKTHFR